MKIKLRDVTFKQYDKWYSEECLDGSQTCKNCPFQKVKCGVSFDSTWVNSKDLFSDKFLDQEIEIDEPILTDEEREYLSAIIKPFRSRVKSIRKTDMTEYDEFEYLWGEMIDYDDNMFILPLFEKGTMYTGMEANKKYTLEELGL